MEVQGKVKSISEVQSFNSGFKKRELVLVTEEQYPQTLLIEFVQDRTSLLDRLSEGTPVKVSINLRGREWVNPEGITKYFNSIQGWRIELVQGSDVSAPTTNLGNETSQTYNTSSFNDNNQTNQETDFDDLPF